ncbi:MAG: agmatinase [Candidatus Kapaibacteriales bacterium]
MLLDKESNFLALEEEHCGESSAISILSFPLEKSVSYGEGTAGGPRAILDSSAFVEFYDEEYDKELCFEKGIATYPIHDFADESAEKALEVIYADVKNELVKGKFVISLGGEHTISASPIKAHLEQYPDLHVLQVDAHSDLRDTYEGSKLSHASVMARVCEFLEPSRVHQVGIRAQCIEERQFIREKGVNTYFAHELKSGLHGGSYGSESSWQKKVVDGMGEKIYLTFDVDGLDPSIMPSTGTPEPNGLYYHETLDLVREIAKQGKQIVGFDVVELAPVEGLSHPDILTARLIYKILNIINYQK